MVTVGRVARWGGRLLAALGDDVRRFRATVGRRQSTEPTLRVYDLSFPHGRRRLHLRTAADGSAVLLVDATDAIHLNPTAAILTRLALESTPVDRAATLLRSRFRGVGRDTARSEADKVYALVDRLTSDTDSCPTCGLTDIEWSPPFSVPVSAPYKADVALTYRCNNACPHCYSQHRNNSLSALRAPLSPPQWHDVLRRLSEIGIPHVIFTGGEPTLVEGLEDLIRTAAGLGLVTGLNTNGRRLSERRFAASLRAAGLDHVQVTLESHRPEVHNAMTGADSFGQTNHGIHNALDEGLYTITNTTLTRKNIDHADKIVEYLHQLGMRTFAMNSMIYTGGGQTSDDAVSVERLAPVLADVRDCAAELRMRFLWYTPTEYCRLSPVELELGPRRCNAGEYSICIEPNGDILPCQSYYVPAGNLLRDPWEHIWQSELFGSFRRRVSDPRGAGLPERCWSCPDLAVCAGGCRIEREHLRKAIDCKATFLSSAASDDGKAVSPRG